MTSTTLSRWFALAALPLALGACKKDEDDTPLTFTEASQAVEEASIDGQAAMLTGSAIELTTSFTIGEAVEKAAGEVSGFITSQLPCARVTTTAGVLVVEYGKSPGNCTFHGRTFEGMHTISVIRNAPGEVQVDHTWKGLQDGRLQVDGTATVTWSGPAMSRRIQHDLTWTRLRDGRTGRGTGDRTQTALAGGVVEGIEVDGERSWTGSKGTWNLDLSGVQVRWVDPVPQAGSYSLTNPDGRTLSLDFARVDEDTIKVTVSGPRRSFDLDVNRAGDVK